MTQVQDIGEQGLLKRLKRFCPQEIVGDDAAVLAMESGHSLVVTTDMLVDGVHFSDRTTSPFDVGWRAAAANLSDLAAMGASPLGVTISLGLRGDVSLNWLESVYEGLHECLTTYNTPLVGGDICRSSVVTLSITAFGQILPNRVIRRSTAQIGDAIVVTGIHGASRAGLELLLHPEKNFSLSSAEKESLIQAHQRPQPRLDVLPTLWEIIGENTVSGMDSSDGLADAVIQICQESGVGAEINAEQIPMPPIHQKDALEWALYGGEDFELVLCLPQVIASNLVQRLGSPATIIGTITASDEVQLQGTNPPRTLSLSEGFAHF